MNKLISIKNLEISFKDKKILNGLSFDLFEKETVSLVWKNWSWKSSLIKSILWEIKYNWEIKKFTNKISYVPQKLDFDKTISITSFEFIKLFNKISKENVLKMLKNFNSESLLNKKIWDLSWWEFQKILIVNSLLNEPEILLLDEPTASIDKIWEKDFYELITEVKSKYPKLWVIIVSHNLNMVYANSDKIVYLHDNCFCVWTPWEVATNKSFSELFWKDIIPFEHKHNHNHKH